jgi:glyoxylase-like metal-dependent hydrolase (beta-lactamase superfamily II)
MTRMALALMTAAVMIAGAPAHAQQPAAPAPAAPAAPPAAAPAAAPPPFATTKVEGTDNVYIFRFGGHQSMFVVTPEGVIATDPIGLNRPHAVTTYIDEIKKVTSAPIRYVIYSHHHYDHIAGGKPFKDLGATFVAHKNAKARLEAQKVPDIVIPDQAVDDGGTKIALGGTELELHYVGRNHSDNSLVMRLPKEKIIFTVDFIPIATLHWRNMPDNVSPLEWEESLKKVAAMDWDRMIPGHPYAGGRLGTKQDVQNLIGYMQDLATEVKKAHSENKCIDTAIREVKLPKYQSWGNYEQHLPMNVERYCYFFGRGW